MGVFRRDRIDGASLGTFQALDSLVVKAVGVNILLPLPVGLQFQVDHKTCGPVSAPFFRDEKVMHTERSQARRVGHVTV
jgi:hypothetical protein